MSTVEYQLPENLALVTRYDPVLKQKCLEFDFQDMPFDPVLFSMKLTKVMVDNRGLGIAAPQVGVPYRIFALTGQPNIVMFNPKVVDTSDETVMLDEGCLSFPNLFIKIKRPKHIKVRFTMPNGEVETKKYTGMTARAVLHELDHLDGVLFQTRASQHHRLAAIKHEKILARRAA